MPREDREDTRRQVERVEAAREELLDAVNRLLELSRREADLADVAEAARALARALASRARRPAAVDTAELLGKVSAAERAAIRCDAWDDAVRTLRHAETALDLALYDLSTARGEDG